MQFFKIISLFKLFLCTDPSIKSSCISKNSECYFGDSNHQDEIRGKKDIEYLPYLDDFLRDMKVSSSNSNAIQSTKNDFDSKNSLNELNQLKYDFEPVNNCTPSSFDIYEGRKELNTSSSVGESPSRSHDDTNRYNTNEFGIPMTNRDLSNVPEAHCSLSNQQNHIHEFIRYFSYKQPSQPTFSAQTLSSRNNSKYMPKNKPRLISDTCSLYSNTSSAKNNRAKKKLLQRLEELKTKVDYQCWSLRQSLNENEAKSEFYYDNCEAPMPIDEISCSDSTKQIQVNSDDSYGSSNYKTTTVSSSHQSNDDFPSKGYKKHDNKMRRDIFDPRRDKKHHNSRKSFHSKNPNYYKSKKYDFANNIYKSKYNKESSHRKRKIGFERDNETENSGIDSDNFSLKKCHHKNSKKSKFIKFDVLKGHNREKKLHSTGIDTKFKNKIEHLIKNKREYHKKYDELLSSTLVCSLLLKHFDYNKVDIVLFFVVYNFLSFGFTVCTDRTCNNKPDIQFIKDRRWDELTENRLIERINSWKKRKLKYITAEHANFILKNVFRKKILNYKSNDENFELAFFKSIKYEFLYLWEQEFQNH
ncbi:hypothetical protein TUBRATIS_009280 [Tubulinosema ratisbonensis]|uniref:Uncharacterized protein n=1 Tax=Tubulinosema ratisbonensis TaxID=291195 RepID=A0A437ANJ1_9MICR|nr:hypothetical protein TUBRATIS_009280 [Tubulinosema ratisbonensis]